MNRKRIFTAMFLMVFAFGAAQAQSGSVGLGVRLNPDGAGLTGKFFLDRNWAIEGQLNASQGFYGTWDDGPSMTAGALLEYHIIFPNPSWRIFLGPGVYFGSWNRYYYANGPDYYRFDHTGPSQGIFGIEGIVGLEYVFKSIPLGISADIQPAMNFAPDATFFPNNFFGISGRYYFGERISHPHRQPVSAER